MHPAIQAVLTVGVAVIAAIGYFYLSNLLLDRVLFPARGKNAGRNINRANMIRPWLFLFPALFALCLYLAYPVVETIRLSFTDRVPGGYEWAGTSNYQQMLREPKFWEALRNNFFWPWWCRSVHAVRPHHRPAYRPAVVGQYREVDHLHADGDQLRRRLGDLQTDL